MYRIACNRENVLGSYIHFARSEISYRSCVCREVANSLELFSFGVSSPVFSGFFFFTRSFDRKLCEELTDIACTYMLEQRERVREKHAATIDQCEKEARRIEKEKKRLRDKKEGCVPIMLRTRGITS